MRIYLAGNFPQMGKLEEEEKMKRFVVANYPSYFRLISFYHNQGAINVLKMKENSDSERNNPGRRSID